MGSLKNGHIVTVHLYCFVLYQRLLVATTDRNTNKHRHYETHWMEMRLPGAVADDSHIERALMCILSNKTTGVAR